MSPGGPAANSSNSAIASSRREFYKPVLSADGFEYVKIRLESSVRVEETVKFSIETRLLKK